MRRALFLLLLLCFGLVYGARAGETVRIGVINHFGPAERRDFVDATIASLRAALAPRTVTVTDLPRIGPDRTRLMRDYDFLVAPAEYLVQSAELTGFRRLVTRVQKTENGFLNGVGTTLVVRADRTDLTDIASLKGRSVAASFPSSLGGWLAFQGRLHDEGFDERSFFGETHFLQYAVPDALRSVLTKATDAALLPACRLEALERSGFIPKGALKVIAPVKVEGFPCLVSTPLYPDVVVASTPKTNEAVAKAATAALLTMAPRDGFEWAVSGDHAEIFTLFQKLEIGPYEVLRHWTLRGFIERHTTYFFIALVVLLLILLNELRMTVAIRRKSAALERALEEKAYAEGVARDTRERLAAMQSRGMVSHLSSMIAHELKQPLSTIINHCNTLKIRLNEALNDDETSGDAVEDIAHAAERITGIIDRVRGYARRERAPETNFDLRKTLESAVHVHLHDTPDAVPVEVTGINEPLPVHGVELELQLLFLNLIRNASNASLKASEYNAILLEVSRDEGFAHVRIVNDGLPIPEETFRLLREGSPGLSSASGGLGIGLSIVHLIADRHGCELRFERRSEGGLEVRVDVPLATPNFNQRTAS